MVSPLRAEHSQSFGGVEDADIGEGAENEQVLIAGDDERRARGERSGEDDVVVGVAAHRLNQGRWLDDLGHARVVLHERSGGKPRGLNALGELRPRNYFSKLREERHAHA